MTARTEHTAFSTAHPIVAATYLAITLGLTMSCIQPVMIALALAGGLAFGLVSRGWRDVLASLRWQLPAILLIACLNPLFSAAGSTEVLRLGVRAVYLESLLYGLSMGGLFVASTLWFRAAAEMLPVERVMALAGDAAPTVALMVSMCLRMVPRLLRQAREVVAVQETSLPAAASRRERTVLRLRASNVLMAWALEDSIETADAMRARGWGAAPRRSTYSRHRLRASDVAVALGLAAAGAVCCFLGWVATSQYAYYPQASRLALWWGYLPIAAWMALPSLLAAIETRRFA